MLRVKRMGAVQHGVGGSNALWIVFVYAAAHQGWLAMCAPYRWGDDYRQV
jgi:hypothetical protein